MVYCKQDHRPTKPSRNGCNIKYAEITVLAKSSTLLQENMFVSSVSANVKAHHNLLHHKKKKKHGLILDQTCFTKNIIHVFLKH